MQVQAIRFLLVVCVLVSATHAAQAAETVLFSNFSPGDQWKFVWDAETTIPPADTTEFPDSLANQKLILLHAPETPEMKLKADHLPSLRGECDVAVQVRAAKWSKGKVSLLLDNIGQPSTARCKQIHDQYAVQISGFKEGESSESIAGSVSQILKTPEEYLAYKGIKFDLPPGPDDPNPISPGNQVTPAKPLLTINGEFSEEARRAKHPGDVMIAAVIGTDGRIHQPRILRGGEMGLGEACLRVLPMWRFEPARQAGRIVASQTHMEMTFNIY